ncbi:Ribonuclease H-like superfamily protein [Rhynchospora pubera]|uniref:Ribonuclease H-like superfamily protein n=1 Tax=Rhynchospora pubera TaxID=906938 RepID=A0AAV8G4Q6_9POAL|nr:Ribonuclease H-like superfamily protein [Rhynchospora pubera]
MIPRVKVFIWRAIQDGLLTSERLHRTIHQIDAQCPICATSEETASHVLFKCTIARLSCFSSQLSLRTEALSDTFIEALSAISENLDNTQYSYLCTLLWCFWKARNIILFQGQNTTPQQLLQQVMEINSWAPKGMQTPKLKRMSESTFTALDGCNTMMVDASWDQQNNTGLAFLNFDSRQKLRWTYAQYLKAQSPFHAETMGLLMAVKHAITHNIQQANQTIILTDCRNLVETLSKDSLDEIPCWHAEVHIHEIQHLLNNHPDLIEIRYVPRQVIQAAHKLANRARVDRDRFQAPVLNPFPTLD